MGELMIRRNRGFSDNVRMPVVSKSNQTSGSAQKTAVRGTGLNISPTLRQSTAKGTEAVAREIRRTLQSGEAVLSEIKNTLDRIGNLVKESVNGERDQAALQKELFHLQEEIDRMIGSALFGDTPLFLQDAGTGDSSPLATLPAWLLRSMVQETPSAEEILSALGLDRGASGAEILAAISGSSLEANPVVAAAAAMYLGTVIAGGDRTVADPGLAAEGLQKLMEAIDDGMTPDEALEMLTNGEFTSFEEFREQFSQGTLPGFRDFLTSLLMTGEGSSLLDGLDLSPLLAGMIDGLNFDLMMSLLDLMEGISLPGLEFGATTEVPPGAQAGGAQQAAVPETQPEAAPVSVAQFGEVQILGRDLSGVSFDEATGVVTVDGSSDIVVQGSEQQAVQGAGQGPQELQITGSGTVTLQNVSVSTLTAAAAETRIVMAGESVVDEVRMQEGTTLRADGGGALHIGSLRGNETNALYLSGGAVVLREQDGAQPGTPAIPVFVDGPVSLAVVNAGQVRSFEGKVLEPFDILWKTFLPGFDSITSMTLDGRQTKMLLSGGQDADPARLWMEKDDLSQHGYPAHRLLIQGRDRTGRPLTRYAFLHWSRRRSSYEASDMYPNPFTVTGGEPGQDWVYEQASCTLRILTSQVSGVSGGSGTDAEDIPFSGRIALADRIGALELALNGVDCRVAVGRAFDLGRENAVTLTLPNGTSNYFESGAGCAGISMGDGTSLRIDCAAGFPAGTLTATGGSGSTGIGRDGGRQRTGHIAVRGGVMTGAEKGDGGEAVTIAGGTAAGAGAADSGSARVLSRMGISLKIGGETVIMPQFRLSARTLRLDGLDVSTKDFAKAAALTLQADKRWVHRLHRVYENMTTRMERSVIYAGERAAFPAQPDAPVRDTAAAASLLEGMSRAIPLSSAQAMRTHGSRDASEVHRLLKR